MHICEINFIVYYFVGNMRLRDIKESQAKELKGSFSKNQKKNKAS